MKTKMMTLLLAAMMLGMPMLQSEMFAGRIKVTTDRKGDSLKGQYPHLAPGHYSRLASATWDEETGLLTVMFNAESEEVGISIYKDDMLIEEDTCPVSEGTVLTFDLSSIGDGDYQIVITGIGNDVLYGNF